jgi:hypothetical protein
LSRRRRFGLPLALPMLLAAPLANPATAPADEYAVKAAFLYNFTRFVEWPESAFAGDPGVFRLCVFGSDPFGERLAAIQRRTVGRRPIAVERPDAASRLPSCQIAYLGRGAGADVAAAATGSASSTTLTVSSDPTFVREGGMFALVTERGRVRLHANLDSVQRSSLQVSAKLLEVAEAGQRAAR